jgi:hypothetical protein
MSSQQTKLAKDLLSVLVDLFPLGSLGKSAIKIPLIHWLDETNARAATQTIEKIAVSVAAELASFPDNDNPGAARASSHDLILILRSSGLNASRMIELDLESDRVFHFLIGSASETLRTASAQRRGFIEFGLKRLAQSLVAASPKLPGVELAFMQAMLKGRRASNN